MVSDHLLALAADSFGFPLKACRFLTGGREQQKQLYTFSFKEEPYILRFVRSPVPSLSQTAAELDWLLFLSGKGLTVPAPFKSRDGSLAVALEDNGETYVVSAYRMARGQQWDKENNSLWNKDVFYRWGRVVGGLHSLTKEYTPGKGVDRRGAFVFRDMFSEQIVSIPSVNRIAENLLNEIESLPKDRDSYGLIHNDLHPGNFLVDGGQIHLFDFDGCAYSWFAFDIGNALFISLWLGRRNSAGVDFTNDLVSYFLKGYLSANQLSGFWLSKIPLFMMCCKIALFSLGCDCENPNQELCDGLRKEQQQHIENGVLFPENTLDYSLFQ